MKLRHAVAIVLLSAGALAQMVDTRVSSRQIATKSRSLIVGSNLTEVAAALYAFETNTPSGFASKLAAGTIVQAALIDGLSNSIARAVDAGGALRFSVTNFYSFVNAATVSVYDAEIPVGSVSTASVIAADVAYAGDARFPRLEVDDALVTMSGSVGAITAGVMSASGTTTLGSIGTDETSVYTVRTPLITPRTTSPETVFYSEIGRKAVVRTSVSTETDASSIVPEVKFDTEIGTNELSVASGVVESLVTNVFIATLETWVTNQAVSITYTNALGTVTNVAWVAVVTNIPSGVVTTNLVNYNYVGGQYVPSVYIYTNGVPPAIFTNLSYNVVHTYEPDLPITNIVSVPVYTYTNSAAVWTNTSPYRVPDTGPVGVCTTSYVTHIFAPGTIKTNASGRLYIHEPAAIQPAGSGTKADPFVMTRPENFRWVRENHKPAGLMAPVRNDSGDGFANDGGSSHASALWIGQTYETPGEYMSTVNLTNGTMRAAMTYCIQTNDIDMIDTYLWAYNQWPNGEFVEGFVGISGAPATGINRRADALLPPSIIVDGTIASATNLLRYIATSNTGVLNSRYALSTWPNKRYAHHLNYDGRGHSLSGIWVGVNPEATGAARGLLGCAVTAPTVHNLRISGRVECDITVATNSTTSYSYVAMGGLFGWVGSGVSGVGTAARFSDTAPINYPGRYGVFTNAIARDVSTSISNCIVFADMDVKYSGERDKVHYPWLACETIAQGGLFGMISIPYVESTAVATMQQLVYDFKTAIRPTQIVNSAIVGQRSVWSSHHGGAFHVGRIVGRIANPRFVYDLLGTSRMFLPCSYGDPPEVERNLFLDNTHIYLGPGEPQRVSSEAYFFDGLDSYKHAAAVCIPSSTARTSARARVPALTESVFDRARLVASELGYYGNLDFVNESYQSFYENGCAAAVSLIGRYGDYKSENSSGGTAPSFTASVAYPGATAYTALAAKDAVRVSYPESTTAQPDYALVSIDGSGYNVAYAGTYAGVYSSNSAVVVNAAALRDETYGPVNDAATRAVWPTGRFDRVTTPNLHVRDRDAMTRTYVMEPVNDVGGGLTTHDPSYPYAKFDPEKWTQPGELDGWYPVPIGVAGLTYSNQAEVVSSVTYPVGMEDVSEGVRVFTGSNATTVATTRYASLAFTNRYAIAASQDSPTSVVFTVLTQVYERQSSRSESATYQAEVSVTNSYKSYAGSINVESGFVSSGPVAISGSVYRVNSAGVTPYPAGYLGDQRSNEYGTLRLTEGGVTPTLLSRCIGCTNGAMSFTGPALPVYFEWWPDAISTNGLSVFVVRGGSTNALDNFNYCNSALGDTFIFSAPVEGYIIVRAGNPTEGLLEVASTTPYTPDQTVLRTNAVFQVSFVTSPLGSPYMVPVSGTLWKQTIHGVATNSGVTVGSAAFIDGNNPPYTARLRVDIYNADGASYDDAAFFESVSVFCNYSKPEYLIPGVPADVLRDRTSPTSGHMEYLIRVRQLVVLQARGAMGSSATVTLTPEGEWPYE